MCQSLLRRPRHTSTSSPALLSACFTRSSSPLPHSQLLPSLRGALTSVVHSPGPEAVIRARGETDRQTDKLSNDEKVGGWGGARKRRPGPRLNPPRPPTRRRTTPPFSETPARSVISQTLASRKSELNIPFQHSLKSCIP